MIYTLPLNGKSMFLVKLSLATLLVSTKKVLLYFVYGMSTWTTVLFSAALIMIFNNSDSLGMFSNNNCLP